MPLNGLIIMEIKLSDHTTKKILFENTYPGNFNGGNDIDEHQAHLVEEDYSINIKEKWFEGIHISIVKISCASLTEFKFELSQNHIGFLFCLEGEAEYFDLHKKRFLSIGKDQQDVSLGKMNQVIFRVHEEVKCVFIQLTQAYFFKITNKEFDPNLSSFKEIYISPEIALILHSLINHQYEGRIKRLFIESKIFELVIQFINKKESRAIISLKADDIKKILLAKKLIEDDLQSPSSLIELSRKVGINDYKLKKGFKEITGNTVFGYLYKLRMDKAHQLLSIEKKTVGEVSFLVGYKNAQHFIVAFKKQYNILPSSLKRNKET
ncbi:helix-turn-helix domain-containing protein [Pedobacter fastidiosus]